MKILTKITNVTRRFKALRRKNSTRKINNINYKGSLQQKLRTAKFLTRSNPFQRISTLSTDLLCYNLFSSKLCRYYSDITNDKGLDGNDSTGNISDKKVIVSFPSKLEPKKLNYVKIPWMQSSTESYIVGAVMPQKYSKENDTKKLCQLVLDNNLSADKLECVKVSLVPVYYGECNAQTLNNAETVVPLCQRDKNFKLNQYFNSKINKLSVSSMMVDVEFNLSKTDKNQTNQKNLLDVATPLTFKTITEGEIHLNKRNTSETMSKDRIDIESLVSAIVSRITSAAIKKAHAQTEIILKSREDVKQTMPIYEPKKIPLRHIPNSPIARSSENINKERVEQMTEPINNDLQNLTTGYTLDGAHQSKVAKEGSSITPNSAFVATVNQEDYKSPPTLDNNALIQLHPKKVNAAETAEIPMSSVFLDCFAIFKKKGKEETLNKLFKDKKRGKFLTQFSDDKDVHNVKSELNINMGVMGGSTLEPPIKEIFVSKSQERETSTCKGSDQGSGKGSACPSSKKSDMNVQGKDSNISACQKSQKGADNKGSKSSVCGSTKKGDSGNKGSKSSICGTSGKKAADKKDSKSSVCGAAKKSADKKGSKTSVCGPAKKGGDKKAADKKGSKTSICGSAKKGGDKKDSKTSICGSAKKGGDKKAADKKGSKTSICGSAKKGGDKKGSKTSLCGSAKKGGDKKGSKTSICGSAKKGGDKKGSKTSICGSAKKGGDKKAADKKGSKTSICGSAKKGGDKKDSKTSICGSAKKGGDKKGSKSSVCGSGGDKKTANKKGSKTSICGSGKKGGDKKASKSNVCGSGKKGAGDKGAKGSACPPRKKPDTKNIKRKSSKSPICPTKSAKGGDNKGSKSSVCGSAKKGDAGKKGSKTSICGSSGKKAADKKGSKSSICGPAKKGGDKGSKSVCGSGTKGAEKKGSKTSICGAGKGGGKSADKKASKTSICGPAKKGGDKKGSKTSVCGSAKKGGADKKGSKTSICGSKKGGDKKAADKKGSKASICGAGKKGADKKGSKSSICGSAKKGGAEKKGSKSSICGPSKKGSADKKGSKTSICGSGNKGGGKSADKKGSKSSICGSAKKGGDKKAAGSKSSVCGSSKKGSDAKKGSKSSVCGSGKKSADKKGSKSSVCGSSKKGADKKGSKSSICGPKKPTKNNKPDSELVEAICIVKPPIEVKQQEPTEKKPSNTTCSSESNTILIDLIEGIKLKIDNIDISKVKFNERAIKDYLSDKTSMIITIQLPKENFPKPFPKPGISNSNDASKKDVKKYSTMANNTSEIIDKNSNEIIVKIIKEESTD